MPKVVDRKKFKRELLEKAAFAFRDRGYASLNMKELAVEMGVSTGTIYHYFPKKEDLFMEMFRWHGNKAGRELYELLCGCTQTTEKLKLLFQYFQSQCETMRSQFLFSLDIIRNENKEIADSILRSWYRGMNLWLSRTLPLSRAHKELIFAVLSGTLYGFFVGQTEEQRKAIFDELQVLLKNDMEPSP